MNLDGQHIVALKEIRQLIAADGKQVITRYCGIACRGCTLTGNPVRESTVENRCRWHSQAVNLSAIEIEDGTVIHIV